MNDIKQQLAPSWSAVNIVISVFLVFTAWPVALVFIAYVVWGSKVDLDLARPETLKAFGRRMSNAFSVGIEAFKKGQ